LSLQQSSAFRRGLPDLEDLRKPNIAQLFRAVLVNHYVTLDSMEDKTSLNECFKRGWLHADTAGEGTQYIFTTPLHRWFIEYYLGTEAADSTPSRIKTFPLL
jgi:hypothetical protein